jgi:copper chaperone CopZ
MKSITTKLIAASAIFYCASSLFSLTYAAETVKITVNGMVCAFCAQGIEKRLSKLPATKAVLVDLKQRTVAVEAKDGQKLNNDTIRSEITEAGYDVVKLEASNLSLAQIQAELKAKK